MSGLTVASIGNFQRGQTNPPPWSTETHFARSFEALGHTVIRIQENEPDTWPTIGLPDLVLYCRTWDTPEVRPLLENARRQGIPTAAVHLDIFRGLAREHQVAEQAMFTMVDDLFTADGDATDWYAEKGIRHHWLPPGVVADEAFDADSIESLVGRWDVAFVGSRSYHPEFQHRPQLIDFLRETYGDRFVHIGGDGEHVPELDVGLGATLRGTRLNEFLASVPIIVGDSCCVSVDGHYWSDRVPEVFGRGGFLIHPFVRALDESMGLAMPAWSLGDWQGLHDTIETSLRSGHREGARQQIAAAVRAEHTYTNRAATILDTLGLR